MYVKTGTINQSGPKSDFIHLLYSMSFYVIKIIDIYSHTKSG